MEKSLLTSDQFRILELISKDEFITKTFFLTGGTALSEFYFRHRFSEDFDFFSEKEFNNRSVLTSINSLSRSLKLKKIEEQKLSGQNTFYLYFDDKNFVKIDFAFFPFPHLGSFKKYKKLRISSVEDICVNKVHAITTRKRSRDYLDLYFCINHLGWSTLDLIKNYRLKFDISISPEQLATSFTNVIDATDMPLFMGKMPWKDINTFFLNSALSLKKNITK